MRRRSVGRGAGFFRASRGGEREVERDAPHFRIVHAGGFRVASCPGWRPAGCGRRGRGSRPALVGRRACGRCLPGWCARRSMLSTVSARSSIIVRAFRMSMPVNGPQSRSRRSGVVSRGSLCGSFKIVAVSTQRFRSLHSKASKRMPFSSSRRVCACAMPSLSKCPGKCPCSMLAAFSSVCPCRTR